MLVELSVVEQRYHAVMEVLSAGAQVTEVAKRYGVSRKSVHAWIRRYRDEGLAGLEDRSHRPRAHPWQLDAEIEARVCELRREYPRWGPRRLAFELERAGVESVPSLSTIYRVLKRHDLVEGASRKRRREDYRRWQRGEPMQLWQMDIMGSVMLVDGTECKLISGIDDHSRFCVIAAVVPRATARAVCRALVAALETYGVPEEILTDNGKQFTGKYGRPRPSEVLFDRICRNNGITHLLTKIRSPTTTGKVERWHRSIQEELLADEGPFADIEHARRAVEKWQREYNTQRPHQALNMATPAEVFQPASGENGLVLWRPPELDTTPVPSPDVVVEEDPPEPEEPTAGSGAVVVERVVPASGNLWLRGQQFWFGPQRARQRVRIWIDSTTAHVSLDGWHYKTLPSRLSSLDLDKLRAAGAPTAGPPPPRPDTRELISGDPVAIERVVTASGTVSVARRSLSVGQQWAGRHVTLRLENDLAHVIINGTIVRTLSVNLSPSQRLRLQGARPAGPAPEPDRRPARIQRKVSARGATQVTGQTVQVGYRYAGRVVTIEVDETVLRVFDESDEAITTVPRTTTAPVVRHKAYGHRVESSISQEVSPLN